MDWQLADAKNRFSELVSRALTEGPQRVTRRNEAVVLVAEAEYERLTGKRQGFIEFLLNGPDFSGVDLTRDRSAMREVDLGGDDATGDDK
jgi:prevent-host-death family protein